MKRIAVLTTIVGMLATACSGGGEDPTVPENGEPRTGPVSPVEGLKTRPGPGAVQVPAVEQIPVGAQGGSTTVDFQVIEATTEPLADNRSPRPVVLLMRSPDEANLVFEKLPQGARSLVLEHRDWQSRSLLLFTGGAQPDPSYRVVLRDVGVIGGGKTVQVFGRFRVRKGNPAEVISEPWVLASVRAGFVVKASECLLVYPDTSAIQTNCH